MSKELLKTIRTRFTAPGSYAFSPEFSVPCRKRTSCVRSSENTRARPTRSETRPSGFAGFSQNENPIVTTGDPPSAKAVSLAWNRIDRSA